MPRLFFLPGVGGDRNFWRPLSDLLPMDWDKVYFGWPGLGANPPHPDVRSYGDLISLVERRLDEDDDRVDLLAQSMGGAIALSLALRHPRKIRRLVLAVTAGGLDVSALGAADWRPLYKAEFPHVAEWVMNERPDVSQRLNEISQPALLIWGDSDPISPVSVGEYLRDRLPNAELHIVKNGEHDLIKARASEVRARIESHLSGA